MGSDNNQLHVALSSGRCQLSAVAQPDIFSVVLFDLFLPDFALRAKSGRNESLPTLLPQANPADEYATA
jgi:hypothetical protein